MGVTVREKAKGQWWVFINHNGKRKSKKIGRDKRLAVEVAKKIEARLALGELNLGQKGKEKIPTLKEYVYGWKDDLEIHPGWFTAVVHFSLKNSTKVGYKNILSRHIIPTFGNYPLDEITSRMINDFIYRLFRANLNSRTIKNIKNCLSAILRNAKQNDYIKQNTAREIIIPRPENEQPSREPSPFTWEEREHFEQAFEANYPRYSPLVICGFRTGLRIGELLGLQWGDIDFYNKLILVQRNLTLGKVTTPKTLSGKRMVRMTSYLVETFRGYRQRIIEEKLRKGWKDLPEWVFINEQGGFINYGNFIKRIWNRVITISGLSRRTPHDMRHTYATLRLSNGDSLAEVSKEMGHGNTDITYRTYYKWMPKESRTNIDALDTRQHPSAPQTQPENKKGLSFLR
ncbi:MAG: tyrosine-type recombinase/integrase [Pseudomonadota bacterium]